MAKKNFLFRLQSLGNICLYSLSLHLQLECISISSYSACPFFKKNLLGTYYVSGRIVDIGDIDQVPALTDFLFCIDIISLEEIDNLNLTYIV